MPKARIPKPKQWLLAAVSLLAAFMLTIFSPTALAADENTGAVLENLAVLRRADIEPWEGDVRRNEALVENLLQSFTACTSAERGSFTEEQRGAMRAYFELLYAVQGKDAAELATLFETGTQLPPSSASAQSTAPPQVSSSVSSSASLPISSAAMAQSVPQASAGTTLPGTGAGPAAPGGGGWLGLFGNRGLGSVLLAMLLGLAFILFLRFVAALRQAGRAPKGTAVGGDLRAKELFGENYSEAAVEQLVRQVPAQRPLMAETRRPAPKRAAATKTAAQKKRTEPPALPPEPEEEAFAARHYRKGPKLNAFFRRVKEEKSGKRNEKATPEAPGWPEVPPIEFEDDAPPPEMPLQGLSGAALSVLGRNPDKPNSITLRAFSKQPRTGRPAKMTFRQGDPGDLDAIDE